jgi:hypothetical protein
MQPPRGSRAVRDHPAGAEQRTKLLVGLSAIDFNWAGDADGADGQDLIAEVVANSLIKNGLTSRGHHLQQ